MRSICLGGCLILAAMVGFGADKVNQPQSETDAALADRVRHEIAMYGNYSIFDDVSLAVSNGNVKLMGVVSQPFKKTEIDRLAKNVAGAGAVASEIRVLPASFQDDRLRMLLARAIYGDPAMTRYAIEPMKPIHILVENGHVTLTGFVDSEFDKQIAGARAATTGLSFGPVVNNLQVVRPA